LVRYAQEMIVSQTNLGAQSSALRERYRVSRTYDTSTDAHLEHRSQPVLVQTTRGTAGAIEISSILLNSCFVRHLLFRLSYRQLSLF
jgi:hypothetical protein